MSQHVNSISNSIRAVPKVYQDGAQTAWSLRFQNPCLIIAPDRPEMDDIGRCAPWYSNTSLVAGSDPMERILVETDLRFLDAYLPTHAGGIQGPDSRDYYYEHDTFTQLNRDEGEGCNCVKADLVDTKHILDRKYDKRRYNCNEFGGKQCTPQCNCGKAIPRHDLPGHSDPMDYKYNN